MNGDFIAGFLFGILASFLIRLWVDSDDNKCNHEFGKWRQWGITYQERDCIKCGFNQKRDT